MKVQKVISLILATAGGRPQGMGEMSQNVNPSTQQKINELLQKTKEKNGQEKKRQEQQVQEKTEERDKEKWMKE